MAYLLHKCFVYNFGPICSTKNQEILRIETEEKSHKDQVVTASKSSKPLFT